MPLTKTGNIILDRMRQKYGEDAERIFYSSINKKKKGSEKWHLRKKKKRQTPHG